MSFFTLTRIGNKDVEKETDKIELDLYGVKYRISAYDTGIVIIKQDEYNRAISIKPIFPSEIKIT